MGRPALLTKEIKEFIAELISKNPYMKAKDVIKAVKKYLIEVSPIPNSKWTRDEIEEIVVKEQLSESAIIKFLTKINKNKPSELDNPWSIDKTPELSPEAISAVFDIQRWLESVKDKRNIATAGIKEWTQYWTDNEMTTSIWPLTVREAIWVSRLYRIKYILSKSERLHLVELPYQLWQAAKTYSDYQRLCELAGTEFNTTRLDNALRSGSIGKTKYDLFSEYKAKKDGEK